MKQETIQDKMTNDFRRGEIREEEVIRECTHMVDDFVLNEKGELICSKCEKL